MTSPRIRAALVAVAMAGAPLAAQQQPTAPVPASPPAASASQMSQQQINEEMLKELRAIRMLLERLTQPAPTARPTPATAKITNLNGFVLGRADAPLTMVEFTDLQCPFCRQFITTTFDEIKKNWIDTGKLRYISRDFPLDFHAMAMPAARAARCAGEQGKFWEMRLTLMRNANLLTADYIARTAADLKLDPKAFSACSATTKYDAEIQAEMREGMTLGIDGTPGFVLGRTTPAGIEGPLVIGAQPYALFDAKLKELLAAAR